MRIHRKDAKGAKIQMDAENISGIRMGMGIDGKMWYDMEMMYGEWFLIHRKGSKIAKNGKNLCALCGENSQPVETIRDDHF